MRAKIISKLAVIALILFGSDAIYSQTDQTQPKKENVIHIKMIKNINGVQTVVDTTINTDEFSMENGIRIPELEIDKNVDSLMKKVHIEMIQLDSDMKILESQLKELEGLEQLEGMKFDIRIDSNFVLAHEGMMQLKELEGLKDLQGMEILRDLRFDIQIDSNFLNDHDAMMFHRLHMGDLSNIRDTNVKIMILSEDDAEYQKLMEELEKENKEGTIRKEKRVIIIEEDCKEKGKDGEKMILEMQVILKTCNIEDLDKQDRKRLRSEEKAFNEKLKVDQVNFYPNPNNGRFNLGFTLEKQGDTEVTIMDMNGKQVYNEKLPNFTGSYKKEIDISNHSPGVYYIKVNQGKDSFFKKMVLQ